MALFLSERHEPLTKNVWSADQAKQTIHEIVGSAIDTFQGDQLWSPHPDIKKHTAHTKPITGLWVGAAGTIWALSELQQADATLPPYDFTPYLDVLIDKQAASLAERNTRVETPLDAPGYLFGYSGVNLLHWKLTKDQAVLDELEKNIRSNIKNPMNEFMWAAPGTMLVAWFLYEETKEQRWHDLFLENADYLFSTWQLDEKGQCYVWTQDMYGSVAVHLGVIHGVAGNVMPLIKGMDLLTDKQRQLLIERTEQTMLSTAKVEGDLANWLPCLGKPRHGRDQFLVQLCHGAPGVLIGVVDLWPFASEAFKGVLLKAGELVWQAGPLTKPWGLCHGNPGNGYALLKLYELTGESVWLDRARQFAMHAIEQFEKTRDEYNCIRVDSWCGDLGLALFLRDCIDESTQFPMMDYF